MFEKLEVTKMAHGMASHAATRQSAIAQNIANADTPGYASRDIAPFAETWRQHDSGTPLRATRAGHIGAGREAPEVRITDNRLPGNQSPNGNSVSLEGEMMKGVEVRHQHDMALSIYRSTSNVLRGSLGR